MALVGMGNVHRSNGYTYNIWLKRVWLFWFRAEIERRPSVPDEMPMNLFLASVKIVHTMYGTNREDLFDEALHWVETL